MAAVAIAPVPAVRTNRATRRKTEHATRRKTGPARAAATDTSMEARVAGGIAAAASGPGATIIPFPTTTGPTGKPVVRVADLFCGAGGTSSGAMTALSRLGFDVDLVAVNHWDRAIQTHSANIKAAHYNVNLDQVRPVELVPGGHLHLLLASPECTHHSRARGGKPVNDQKRSSAWHVVRWATELWIDAICIENVVEFRKWGPVGPDGKPIKALEGTYYYAFIQALRGLGYEVEDRVLNATDFGAATTRKRLFLIARRDGKPITWPVASNTKNADAPDLLGQIAPTAPWRVAADVIDWSDEGTCAFSRPKPLSHKSLARMAHGFRTRNGAIGEVYARLIEDYVAGRHDPDLPLEIEAELEERLLTETASPFVIQVAHGDKGSPRPAIGVDESLPTFTTKRTLGIARPFIVPQFGEREGQAPRSHDIEAPLPTVTGHGAGALVHGKIEPRGAGEPFILSRFGDREGGGTRAHAIKTPMPTITGRGAGYLVSPQVAANDTAADAAAARTGRLVRIRGELYRFVVLFRMIRNREMARAMGFGGDYVFHGTIDEQTKMIGNAVSPCVAEALVEAIVAGSKGRPITFGQDKVARAA